MGRPSTRTQYCDPDIYNDKKFTSAITERDLKIFMDWIEGMTGSELSKKWGLADITARHVLTVVKKIYDNVKWRKQNND